MKQFMDDNFLLSNETAINLYHKYSKNMPIIDYHCHINPKEILENKKFTNITEAWLYGDHYKWRAMRSFGIEEKYITGDATDYEKFLAWAKTISRAIGNPLYHWTHLELKRFFGIDEILSEKTAPAIWEKANKILADDEFRVRGLLKKANVKVICTTDDPIDTLKYHEAIKADKDFKVKVLPAFRPDQAINITKETFIPWIQKLGKVCDTKVSSYDELLKCLKLRVLYFAERGCKVADHGLDFVPFAESTIEEVREIFLKGVNGQTITSQEENKYKAFTLKYLGELYYEQGWVMQYHMNCLRNNNKRMFSKLGADTGFDSVSDLNIAIPLTNLLNSMAEENKLPKTILYSLDSSQNSVIGTIMGCFQEGGIAGKIQFGSAWWFNDNKLGMEGQIKSLANLGMLSTFIGMLTDSRSFLSYTRHEYFRRILCNVIGEWVENGEVPKDLELLGEIVSNISYYNANNYFDFN